MKLKHTNFQIALEIIAILIILGMIIFIYIRWNQIPQQIPIHYNAWGEVDNWGTKGDILFIPAIAVLIYAFMTGMSFFPQTWNIPVVITDENKEVVYHNTNNLFLLIKVEILSLFCLIVYYVVIGQNLPDIIVPGFLIIMFGTVIFFYLRITRL